MDHDAHVTAYRREQIRKALEAVAHSWEWRVFEAYRGARIPVKKRWTWKNHLANWINKTVKLLERWGV